MSLKEPLRADPVGGPYDRARSASQVLNHPRSYRLEVTRQFELGKSGRLAIRGPKQLVRFGDDRAQHDIALRTVDMGRSVFELLWSRLIKLLRGYRLFRANFFGWLVLTQSLKGRLSDHSVASPTCEFNFGD